MATSNFILDALNNVSGEVADARSLTETFVELNLDGPNSPSWPFVVSRMVERLALATEHLEVLIRQRAVPILQDMEKVMVAK
jgi:hypothetical protein